MSHSSQSKVMLRYLAGDLPAEDVAKLNSDLKEHDPLQHELAELLLQEALLAEIGKERDALPAGGARGRRRFAWIGWAAAAAVLAIVLVGTWAAFRDRYPSPRMSGPVRVAGAGGLRRGAVLSTGPAPATLTLGGYCRVEIRPRSALHIEGREHKEQIFLRRGKVACDVDRAVGEFSVRSDLGNVSATGTRFTVEVLEREGGEKMDGRAMKGALVMVVAVALGSVDVQYSGRTVTLVGGQRQAFGAEREVVQSKSGTVTGVIVAKGETWLEVKADGETKRYIPRWIGGLPKDGGGFEKDMLRAIARMRVGDRLTFEWLQEEHLRIVKVLEYKPSAEGTISAGKPEYRRREGERWAKRGRIVARLYRAPVAEFDLSNAEGKVVKSARTRAGARACEIGPLDPGKYSLRVSARGYRTLELDNLEVKAQHDLIIPIEFTRRRETGEGTIGAGKPEYRRRDGERWAKRGRIVGRLYRAPAAEFNLSNAEGKLVKSVRTRAGARACEIGPLDPGKYSLRVSARGYRTLELDNLEVKAQHDLVIPIEFSRRPRGDGTLPDGIKGFRGMMVGKVLEKGEWGLVLHVEKIARVWKENKASNPESIVGRKVRIVVNQRSRLRERFLKAFKELRAGDRAEVEAFHFEAGQLTAVEHILKVD